MTSVFDSQKNPQVRGESQVICFMYIARLRPICLGHNDTGYGSVVTSVGSGLFKGYTGNTFNKFNELANFVDAKSYLVTGF